MLSNPRALAGIPGQRSPRASEYLPFSTVSCLETKIDL
jgi:hypothetical protein